MELKVRSKKDELLGMACILGAIYLCVALFSYSRWDPALFTHSTFKLRNYGGLVGSYLADALYGAVGAPALLLPFFLVYFGLRRFFFQDEHQKVSMFGALLFILAISVFAGLSGVGFSLTGANAGGALGVAAAGVLVRLVSYAGGYIFASLLFLSSIVLLSPVSVVEFLAGRFGRKARPEKTEQLAEAVAVEPTELIEEPEPPFLFDADTDAAEAEPFAETPDEEPYQVPATVPKPPEGRVHPPLSGDGRYVLPPVELLSATGGLQAQRPTNEELLAGSALLEKKLKDFGVQGKVTQVNAGPVVTMYEFEPAPGVKIQRVISLSDDLSLALKAPSVRISPVPGKSALGIEVPNRQRETVLLRDIISSENFKKNASKLTLALGKDIFGNPVSADLARMPHLLIAGATGAGKSVCLNSIVASILYKAAPDEVKMLLIDPKLLELSAYEGIPHLIAPVVTGPKAASEALKKMVLEMERRYRLIAERGAKGIDGYNRTASEQERMPYIVVVIDELADLMLSSAAEVEDSIGRLAQMARASGIHLIVATQRPSVDVLTGVIKANFPTRISFQVASRIDSRTILDAQGAEQLIGRGDMLILTPGARIMRVHGAFISEQEIKAVSDFVRAQGQPDYTVFEAIKEPEAEEQAVTAGGRDELYERACDVAAAIGEVSISMLQRRLKIGFNRAARIMELMEEDGLVGPPKGAGKPRTFIGRRSF